MTENISMNVVSQWMIQKIGDSMTANEAQKLGVEQQFEAAAGEVDKNELNLNEILQDVDLYNELKSMYLTEQGAKKEDAKVEKDPEEDKKAKVEEKQAGTGV